MRKGIFLFVIFFLILHLNSQNISKKGVFSIFPTIGFNTCQIHGDNYAGYNKFGALAGIGVRANIQPKYSLALEFNFTQKGARHNQNPEKGDFTFYRVNLNYIDLCLMNKLSLNKTYYANLGLGLNYLINYQEDNHVGNWNNVWPFEKFEFSLNTGLGRKLTEKFNVEVRANNSLLPIRPYGLNASGIFYPNAIARFFNKGLYNNTLSLVLTYQISLTKKQDAGN
ncbi:MAG: outer membrane beta-barrel protein [Bacteroidota bacterium]